MRSLLCQLALTGSLATAGLAAETGSPLDVARQLNRAFIQVADTVSPSVVVIEVAHAPEAADDQGGNPLLELIPKDLRKELMERFHKQLPVQPREKSKDKQPELVYDGRGSGIVIRKEGFILTNTHVVDGAEEIRVRLRDGRTFKATVRGVDPQSDIAVIKIDAGDLAPARLGDSEKTRVGEFAIAIGAPFDLDYSVTFGHVSAKGRHQIIPSFANPIGAAMDQDFIQTDASINPGNSGGPLVNIEAEVIGINTLIRGLNTGIGFAVPINLARNVAEHLILDGKFKRAWLGVRVIPLKDYKEMRGFVPDIDEGVVVDRIEPNGPAYNSNLKPADVITSVEGIKVSNALELRNAVRSKNVGSTLSLEVVRDNKPLNIRIKTEEWPADDASLAASEKAETPAQEMAPAWLGLTIRPATKELAEKFNVELKEGVIVTEVREGSIAAKRGIRPGDIIIEVDHKPVVSPKQFQDAIKGSTKKGVILNLFSAKDGAFEFKILKDAGE